MCSGIFAGDIRELSMKSCFKPIWDIEQKHGSLIKGMSQLKSPTVLMDGTIKSPFIIDNEKHMSISFQKGMETLTNALSRKVQV